MCMIEHIDKLVEAGITSLKIEGRAKSAYYVSVIANAYRLAVDEYMKNPTEFVLPQWINDETTKVSHRQYSTGFFFGAPDNGQYYENGGYTRNYDVVAVVDYYKDGFLYITQRNKFSKGEQIEILQPKQKPFKIIIDEIFDLNDNIMQTAPHPMMQIKLPFERELENGTILRKRFD
jgi:putative protease